MRAKYFIPLLALAVSILLAVEPETRDPQKTAENRFKSLFPTSGVPEHVIWDGNNISTVHGNHGNFSDYDVTGSSGTEWPKGSGKTVIFQAGPWLMSGKSRAAGTSTWVDELRSAAAEYTSEFVPGTLDGVTNEGHLYQINRVELDAFLENDYATYSSMSALLPITVVSGITVYTELQERTFPTDDFLNWPVAAGAPWVDANDDGVYNIEDGDHPDILGDMFHWYVMNDGDAGQHTPLWQTAPMNVEVQTSVFGFNQSGPLGDIAFFRWVMINKGADDLDSVFVSIWHDDDNGSANDDLVGCDTVNSIGYTYNDTDGDVMYGVEAPCVASDFFQAPLVNSPGDTASILTWSLANGYHLRSVPDKRSLGMTSFVPYINGDPALIDPNTAEQAYNYMNGFIGLTGLPFEDPNGNVAKYVFSGDPVTGSGWTDDHEPDDRRYLMSSGPFYLGSGDTVEVVGSIIVAAGSNWAKSITKMKYFDNFAQGAFDANFNVCAPASPVIDVAQLDQRVVLSWEENFSRVENYTCTGYEFQGYNIYQGQSATGPWQRIATYDKIDDVKLIMDLMLDEATGELLEIPAQFGTDSGILHYIDLTQDKIGGGRLKNNREYYFTVTAYAYDPMAAKRVIESPVQVIRAVPGIPGVGAQLSSTLNDILVVDHASGAAAASVKPIVIDPYQLNNQDYSMTFESVGDTATKWVLSQGGATVAEGTDFPATQEYFDVRKAANQGVDAPGIYVTNKIQDGFILTFEDGSWGIAAAQAAYAVADADTSTKIVFAGIGGNGPDPSWYGNINTLHGQFPAMIPEPDGEPNMSNMQHDVELRFVQTGSVASYYNNTILQGNQPVDTIMVPFELWDMEADQQINTAVYQVAGPKQASFYALVDSGMYKFTKNYQVIPVYTDYSPDSVYHFAYDASKMGWVLKFNSSTTRFEFGNIFRIDFKNPLIAGLDEYTFNASGLVSASDLDSQMDLINVFPNPYFGQSPEETSPNDRGVFFTHLGIGTTTIRIFTISGDMVARVEQVITSENNAGNRARWDLRNRNGIPVASGMYLAHITVEDAAGKKLGERILKLAIFQPEERLDLF